MDEVGNTETAKISNISEFEQAMVASTPEADNTPSWFNQTVKTVTDAWFDPKSFEQNPEVYEKLGVKNFKKWMPTGDVVRRAVWKRIGIGNSVKTGSIESLKDYESFTRLYEAMHLSALVLFSGALVAALYEGQIGAAAVVAGSQTLLNVYPIMVQRYNRSRLYNTIKKMEERQSRQTAATSDPISQG